MQLDVTLQPGSLLQPRAALKPHQMLPLLSLCLVFLLLSSFNESLKAEGFQALSPFQEPLSDLPETFLSSEECTRRLHCLAEEQRCPGNALPAGL